MVISERWKYFEEFPFFRKVACCWRLVIIVPKNVHLHFASCCRNVFRVISLHEVVALNVFSRLNNLSHYNVLLFVTRGCHCCDLAHSCAKTHWILEEVLLLNGTFSFSCVKQWQEKVALWRIICTPGSRAVCRFNSSGTVALRKSSSSWNNQVLKRGCFLVIHLGLLCKYI